MAPLFSGNHGTVRGQPAASFRGEQRRLGPRSRWRWSLVLAALLAVAVGLGLSIPRLAAPRSPATGPAHVLWGVYRPGLAASPGALRGLEQKLGHPVQVVSWYAQWRDGRGCGDATWAENRPLIDRVSAEGAIPMITWEAWGCGARFPLAEIAAGRYDAYLKSWARGAAGDRHQIWIRIFHEFNDSQTYPWSLSANGASTFVAAWRHIVDVFRAAGADNVRWVWNPDGDHMTLAGIRPAYPGDSYVDYLGWDSYSTPAYDNAANYRVMEQVARKPMVLGEVGASETGWLNRLAAMLNAGRAPGIRALVWFDVGPDSLDRPQVAAAVRSMLAGPAFGPGHPS